MRMKKFLSLVALFLCLFIKKLTQFTRDWVRGIGKKIVNRLDYCLPFNSKSASAYSSNNLLMYV